MHSTNAEIIGPSKVHELAKAVFLLSGLCHPQFGTVWFGKWLICLCDPHWVIMAARCLCDMSLPVWRSQEHSSNA